MSSYRIKGLEGDLRIEDDEGKIYSKEIKTREKASSLLVQRMIRDKARKGRKLKVIKKELRNE